MVFPITIQIAADKDGSTWTDLTPAVKRDSIRMGGQAGPDGQAGTGFGFDFEDLAAAYELPARRKVRLLVTISGDDYVIAQGRVASKAIARRSPPVGDVRGFDVEISDGNAHLQGIPVHRWVRPAETDVARINALADDFLTGNPRVSTDLTRDYLSSSNPIDLPAKTYDATNPAGVVMDICSQTRKRFFITVLDEIFYDADTSTAYAADFAVTDVDPDPSFGSWEFAPSWSGAAATQDGTEFYSGLRIVYGEDLSSLQDSDATAESDHDLWEEVVYGNGTTLDEAASELDAILGERKVEELRFTFSVLLPDDMLLNLRYGQTFSFRAAAAGMLSPVTVRCSRLSWASVAPGLWRASIEAGFPRKLAPRLSRGVPRSLLPSQPIEPNGGGAGSNEYTVCFPTSYYLGVWEALTDPAPSGHDLVIPVTAEGTSVIIGPGTGSTGNVPGWIGSGTYTITAPVVFPLGTDGTGVLSGRVVTPPGPGWVAVDAFFRFSVIDPGGAANVLFSVGNGGAGFDQSGGEIPPNTAVYFKLRCGLTASNLKIWEVGDTEPASYGAANWGDLDGPPNQLIFAWDWTDSAAPYVPPEALTVDQLTWCYTSTYPTAYSGNQYGPVFLGVADGSTSTFSLPDYPGAGYTPGTLMVFVDGVWQPVTETDPTPPGQFDFGVNPDEDDVIYASWRVPA